MQPPSQRNRADSQHSFNRIAYDQAVPHRNIAVYNGRLDQTNRKRPRRQSHFGRWLVILVLLTLGGHILWSKHASADKLAAQQAQAEAAADAQRKDSIFSAQVNALIADNPVDTLGVATISSVESLQTYGTATSFDGASVGKLITAADYLHHIELGKASLNQNIDGESAAYWLKIMLVNSDDTAWANLNDYLTHDDLAAYATSIGLTNYDPNVNTFTTSDIARLLQKLYAGQLLDPANRSLMLSYLAQANYRQYIVPAVPSSDKVYHKIGLDGDEVNDAAIITNGQKYLVLVIFTNGNGSYNWDLRAQLMQDIAKDAITAYL